MSIVCLYGSPRTKGNSAAIAGAFCKTAEKNGAVVRSYVLNQMDFKGCQACYGCKRKSDTCVLEDDLTEVLDAVRGTDILVMASPVYYGDVSAQLKAFIDRTFSFLVPDYTTAKKPHRLEGDKRLVMILSQGHPDEDRFSDIYPKYSTFFGWMGFQKAELIRSCGVRDLNDISKRPEILAQAEALAARLVG
jgi:multimeric flavodoxin WrbA